MGRRLGLVLAGVLLVAAGSVPVGPAAAVPPPDGGWTVDAYGGVHAFGGAPPAAASGYWPGWDVARGIAADDDGPGGWVVDAFGGLHPFGGAPRVAASSYWPGWDIARGIAVNRTGPGGWVLDGWGGLHPFGGAPAVGPGGYWPAWDVARGVLGRPGGGGWVLDAWGGLHAFGGAPGVVPGGYWPGQSLARGVSGAGGSSGHRVPPPRPRRTVPVVRTYTYSITVRGSVHSNLGVFTDAVAETLQDERSWAGAGIEFVQVPSGGHFTVVLTQDALMPSFGPPCSRFYSCRQGRYVAINDDRFAWGSPYWPGPVSEYRHMVINHEVGHWLGFGHAGCGGPGQPAPVMMQQSKGLQGCAINPWPLPHEIARAKANIGAWFDPAGAPGAHAEGAAD